MSDEISLQTLRRMMPLEHSVWGAEYSTKCYYSITLSGDKMQDKASVVKKLKAELEKVTTEIKNMIERVRAAE